MSNTVDKHTPGICGNCGADEGLHHYETRQCPKNGVEEWRDGKKQEWQETFFENRKWQQLIASAPQLKKENEELKEQIAQSMRLYECQNNTIIKLQERNRALVEALDGLMERCILTIEGVGNFKIRHSNEFKAAKKAIESNQ